MQKNFETEVLHRQSFVSSKGNLIHLTSVLDPELGVINVFDNQEREVGDIVTVSVVVTNIGGRLGVRSEVK